MEAMKQVNRTYPELVKDREAHEILRKIIHNQFEACLVQLRRAMVTSIDLDRASPTLKMLTSDERRRLSKALIWHYLRGELINTESPQPLTQMDNQYSQIPVAQPTLVYGQDISKLSADQLIEQVKELKKKAAALNIEDSSAHIKQRQTAINKAVEALIKELDSRPVEG